MGCGDVQKQAESGGEAETTNPNHERCCIEVVVKRESDQGKGLERPGADRGAGHESAHYRPETEWKQIEIRGAARLTSGCPWIRRGASPSTGSPSRTDAPARR